jgi:hypothetical protein
MRAAPAVALFAVTPVFSADPDSIFDDNSLCPHQGKGT